MAKLSAQRVEKQLVPIKCKNTIIQSSIKTTQVFSFIDNNFIINKLGQEGAAAVASMKTNEFNTSTYFSLGAPDMGLQTPEFSTEFSSSNSQQENKKNSWKFWQM